MSLVLALFALIAAGSAEDLLPVFWGVGFPVLLSLAVFAGASWRLPFATLTAIGAGLFEEALSSLPLGTGVAFFLAAAALVRLVRIPALFWILAFPVYQLWLALWVADLNGSVFLRTLLAFPAGALTGFLTAAVLGVLQRKAGLDED